jgi:uncharacterized membrane protein
MADLLPASLAALRAVIGLFVGVVAGSLVSAVLGFGSDVIPAVLGGLGGALALGWLGVRAANCIAARSVEPS